MRPPVIEDESGDRRADVLSLVDVGRSTRRSNEAARSTGRLEETERPATPYAASSSRAASAAPGLAGLVYRRTGGWKMRQSEVISPGMYERIEVGLVVEVLLPTDRQGEASMVRSAMRRRLKS